MNTDVMFSSKTDLWATPKDFFEKLNEEFHFTLDVCATPENAKCSKYYTKEQDGLKQDWVDLKKMEQFGATLLMGERSANGSRKHIGKTMNLVLR